MRTSEAGSERPQAGEGLIRILVNSFLARVKVLTKESKKFKFGLGSTFTEPNIIGREEAAAERLIRNIKKKVTGKIKHNKNVPYKQDCRVKYR